VRDEEVRPVGEDGEAGDDPGRPVSDGDQAGEDHAHPVSDRRSPAPAPAPEAGSAAAPDGSGLSDGGSAESGTAPPHPADGGHDLGRSLAALVRVVEELRADRDEDRALIDELLAELAHQGVRKAKHPPVYETWQTWVDTWLAARISRHPHRYRWCHQYADHPEVADRLEALWHAWEARWPDPLARLDWYREGLDHQLAVIMAEDGPMRSCSAVEHQHSSASSLDAGRRSDATALSTVAGRQNMPPAVPLSQQPRSWHSYL
jgi:hypothetical protein